MKPLSASVSALLPSPHPPPPPDFQPLPKLTAYVPPSFGGSPSAFWDINKWPKVAGKDWWLLNDRRF